MCATEVKIAWGAVVVLLLVYIAYKSSKESFAERVYTSGANIRILSEPTQPQMGYYDTQKHMQNIMAMSGEHMTPSPADARVFSELNSLKGAF